ncbi:MAG: flagellar biosynthetic protein FliR [Myxococcales bacterium]|nr:flagellar biosynthetic protein FliR [Myxococcales bacterium]
MELPELTAAMKLARELVPPFVSAFLRIAPVCLAAPFFGGEAAPVVLRLALAVGAAGAATTFVAPAPGSVFVDTSIGIILAITSLFVFRAMEMAGRWLDVARGAQHVETLIPELSSRSSPLGTAFHLFTLAVFASIDGHARVFECLVAAAGIGSTANTALQSGLIGVSSALTKILSVAFGLVAPGFAALLLVDLGISWIARMIPGLQTYLLSFGLKAWLGIFFLAMTLEPLARGVVRLLEVAGGIYSP